MGRTAPVAAPTRRWEPRLAESFRFESLVLTEAHSLAKGRGTTAFMSFVMHALLVALVVILPLTFEEVLPAPAEALRAFFVTPPDVAAPPPPPPPPAAGVRPQQRTPAAPRPTEPAQFTAPVEIPEEIAPEESLDLGVEGGVPGGVEGGVPGGVLGGVVGGLPSDVAPPPPRLVRVGGAITAPKLLKRVNPEYPVLAAQARLAGLVILEAEVDMQGRVTAVRVLRGAPLFDEAALAAVKQWRYQPLLLNGQPTPFLVSVTVVFNLKTMGQTPQG